MDRDALCDGSKLGAQTPRPGDVVRHNVTQRRQRRLPRPRRFTVVIAVGACLLIAFVWAFTFQRIALERGETVREAFSHNNNLALTLEEHALRTFDSADQMLVALRRHYREHGPEVDVMELVRNGSFDPSLFNAAGIVNANGDFVSSLRGGRGSVADREYFTALRSAPARGFVLAKPIVGRISGVRSLFVSRALNEPDEPFSGIAMVGIPQTYFQTIYDRVDVGRGGVVVLIGTDGIVRGSPARSGIAIGDDLSATQLFAELRKARSNSFVGGGKLDGITRLVSYRMVKGLPLVVVVATAQDEVLASSRDRATWYVQGAVLRTVMILLVAAGIWFAFHRERRAHERMRALSSRLLEVQEGERRMLARELHDDVGQELTGIRLLLSSVATTVGAGPRGEDLAHCQQAVDAALAKVRDLSLDLRPSQLDELGLVAALRWHVDRVQRTAKARIVFVHELGSTRLPPEIEIAAFRIAQEALNNAVKHARAGCIEVGLHLHRELELTVRDDGVGLVPAQARRSAAERGSMGLLSMEERARLVGGRFELVAADGQGCTVRCHLPLEPSPRPDELEALEEV